MKIGLFILGGYFLIVALVGYLVQGVFVNEVKPGVRATLEDTLVDTAQLLAELVADDVKAGRLDQAALVTHMTRLQEQKFGMQISGVAKHRFNFRVYITDARGQVLFDSEHKAQGQDYSRWNDVYLTLRGQYGARSTRIDARDDRSSVMHVAAPVKDGSRIIGVLTVAKPIATISPFIERSQQKILKKSGLLLLAALLIGIGISWWLSRALGQLQRYAASVERGEKVVLPPQGRHEIGELGRSLEAMRIKLEGKQYVEQLMHTLTHELKSPIAAIGASAELLGEAMPEAQRQQFLANIIEQNQRQKQLIDKLLALVRLEQQQSLIDAGQVALEPLLDQVVQDAAGRLLAKQLQVQQERPAGLIAGLPPLRGDALLLRQALGNLLDNAIDFAPVGSSLQIVTTLTPQQVQLFILDRGPGIPDYALPRIFERFYSLPRPEAAKSTGLGLPFVREVALLHGGTISVTNRPGGGVCACLSLPLP